MCRGLAPAALVLFLAPALIAAAGNESTGVFGPHAAADLSVPQIAFFRVRVGRGYDIGIAEHDGRHLRILTGRARKGTVVPHLFTRSAWAPDGRRIAFSGVRRGDPAGARGDIYVMQASGRRQRRVTRVENAFGPLWSPDGRKLLFTRLRLSRGSLSGSLWSVRPDGSGLRRITRGRRGRVDSGGSFSPDGTAVAFTRTCVPVARSCPSSGPAVFLARADGSRRRTLIAGAGDPRFSPDGKRIALVSDRDHNGRLSYGDTESFANELYVMNADGTGLTRLTSTHALNEGSPSWLPDGARIAFQRGRMIDNAEGTAILEVNADGTCEREMLADPRLDTWYASPAWRPGKALAGGGPLAC